MPLCLTELMICQWHFNPKIKHVDTIIAPFARNPLGKPILIYIEVATPTVIEPIAHLFPSCKSYQFSAMKSFLAGQMGL